MSDFLKIFVRECYSIKLKLQMSSMKIEKKLFQNFKFKLPAGNRVVYREKLTRKRTLFEYHLKNMVKPTLTNEQYKMNNHISNITN